MDFLFYICYEQLKINKMSKYSNEVVTTKGLSIKFHHSNGDSRSNDNLTKMVCFHNRYNLGDKHDYNKGDYDNWETLKDAIEENEKVLLIKPLYMYDHSGITIATSPFSCGFDSGQIGWIYITDKEVEVTGAPEDSFDRQLEGEVSTYNQELEGEVFGYVCYKDGESEDSCGGFYGRNPHENGIFDNIPKEFESLLENIKYLEVEE